MRAVQRSTAAPLHHHHITDPVQLLRDARSAAEAESFTSSCRWAPAARSAAAAASTAVQRGFQLQSGRRL